jgi:hypothetical protein
MTSPSASERGFGLVHALFLAMTLAIAASVALMSNPALERSGGPNLTYKRMDSLKAAATRYREHGNGSPPTLDSLTVAPTGAAACAPDTNSASPTFRKLRGWCGPYLDREAAGTDLLKRDGWNTLFQYNGSTLTSCGPNRACGDGDDIAVAL